MKPERWEQINDLFQSAVERAPEDRAAFLEEACRGDEALCREVKSLIACYEPAQGFIESSAFEVAPELLADARPGAMVGESIGHYRVESLIGVGGMGEVYLARDERLGREVALKFLPEQLTADKIQLSRFKSEARVASALNHPNILTVYEIGVEGNRHFIATEFIKGVTLRASLAHGRMNVHDALEIAVQVASALSAAHEAGVVHRDIKPENIMLRPDGYVKVLDFGIAKLTEQQPASDQHDPARTMLLQTHPGLVMGTARYASPEQTRGQSTDARSDIWNSGRGTLRDGWRDPAVPRRDAKRLHRLHPDDGATIFVERGAGCFDRITIDCAKGFAQKQERALPDNRRNARRPPLFKGETGIASGCAEDQSAWRSHR